MSEPRVPLGDNPWPDDVPFRGCQRRLVLALVLTAAAMWTHRRELRSLMSATPSSTSPAGGCAAPADEVTGSHTSTTTAAAGRAGVPVRVPDDDDRYAGAGCGVAMFALVVFPLGVAMLIAAVYRVAFLDGTLPWLVLAGLVLVWPLGRLLLPARRRVSTAGDRGLTSADGVRRASGVDPRGARLRGAPAAAWAVSERIRTRSYDTRGGACDDMQ